MGVTRAGQPGVDFMRSGEGGWKGLPGRMLSPATCHSWNTAWADGANPHQGYVVYLGEAMRREATRGEAPLPGAADG